MVLLSYRYSYARIQYTVLEKGLDSGNKLPLDAPPNDMLESAKYYVIAKPPDGSGGLTASK